MRELTGLNIIMIGGNGGMGAATAKLIAKPGVCISVCGRKQETLDALEAEVKAKGADTYFKSVDITKVQEVTDFVNESVDKFGSADILINFAGLSINANLEDITEEQWDTVMDVNVKGTYFATQAFAKRVDAEKGALVINFASMASKRPMGLNPHYAAAKSAVSTITQALSNQMKKKNIKFTVMSPGPAATTFFAGRKTAEEMSKFMSADDIAETLEFIMLRSDRLVFHDVAFDSYAFFNK